MQEHDKLPLMDYRELPQPDMVRRAQEFYAEIRQRHTVRQFSDRPVPREVIDKLFSLGVMGIEVPESLGGGGASFFHSVLAIEALSRGAACVTFVDDGRVALGLLKRNIVLKSELMTSQIHLSLAELESFAQAL